MGEAARQLTDEEREATAAMTEAARRKASTHTSADGPTAVAKTLETRTADCPGCGDPLLQTQMPSGRWMPEQCQTCIGPAPEPEPDPAYTGDILADLHQAGVNVRKYQDATLANFDASDDPGALDAALLWIDAWARTARRRFAPRDWVFFYGDGSRRVNRGKVELGKLGNGKTFLAIAMARELIERGLLDPQRFAFRTAEAILIESEATFKSQAEDSEKRLLARYERPDLLIIDDLGVRHDPTPHAVRVFDELTKRREANGTIWTSNLSIPVLQSGETMRRIADRIAGECGDGARYIQKFSGPSRRRQRSMGTTNESEET